MSLLCRNRGIFILFHRSSSSWKRLGANSLSGNGRAVVSRCNPGEGAALAETTGCFEGELEVFPLRRW